MLQRAFYCKDATNEFVDLYNPSLKLIEEDWNKCFIYMIFLEKFSELTNLFSGYYYPSSHLVVNKLTEILQLFYEYRKKDEFWNIIAVMEVKFYKYWEDTPTLFCLAAIMDPRIKLEGLEEMLQMCAGFSDYAPITIKAEQVSVYLFEMFEIYQKKYKEAAPLTPQRDSTGKFNIFRQMKSKTSKGLSRNNELQNYLQTDFITTMASEDVDNLNIFGWWKRQSNQFPVLFYMARDLLTVPVSTVASEQAFSAGGRVVIEKRSRLSPKTLEMLVCAKDWLMQKSRNTTIFDEFEESSSDE